MEQSSHRRLRALDHDGRGGERRAGLGSPIGASCSRRHGSERLKCSNSRPWLLGPASSAWPSPGRWHAADSRSSSSRRTARLALKPPRATAKSSIRAFTTIQGALRPAFVSKGAVYFIDIARRDASHTSDAESSWWLPPRPRNSYLDHLLARAETNGVEDVERIGQSRLASLEPEIVGKSALLSNSTGIVDSHALMLSYQADIEAAGGTIVFHTPIGGGAMNGSKIQLVAGGSEPTELEADLVVNAAGLHAWDLSTALDGLDRSSIPPRFLAKGNYFNLTGAKAPFRHLVYPVPERGGLGIHLTLDLAGRARFGPDVEWVDAIGYAVDPSRAPGFYAAIRRYWPKLGDGALVSAYSGIRPKTAGDGPCDFVIQGPAQTGHPSYIALYGIESPGLTSALTIGEHVAELAESAR